MDDGGVLYSQGSYPYNAALLQAYRQAREARRSRTKSDAEIEADVSNEMHWSVFVDANQVTVQVDDGVVTLRGEVDTVQERVAAVACAYHGGALAVDEQLVLSR